MLAYKAHPKERTYFILKVVFTLIILAAALALLGPLTRESALMGAASLAVFLVYGLMIWLFVVVQKVLLVGFLKGNGVPITERQFPEVHRAYKAMAAELGLSKVPPLFALQEGGVLNAFAIRLSGRNYIALYTDVLALLDRDPEAVRFVLGHELGHVARHHLSKRFWTFPSSLVPFLTPAYSRACEYSCDNIGAAISADGARRGLLLLAAGPELYGRVSEEAYLADAADQESGATRFAGICASHPFLPKRLRNLGRA